ncbi:hypothetical protein XA68_14088 [Ophiocordyceps unilateralis]|uniref:RING-type domain-containing protein n=1 Tax=Ophiocordyceps unilateralis TaxID=268505 RepID=A0A2A9P9H1_OPHUN|nr:hypothetical protein XA68_14088 [Ophiocordyceps unilateralis]
MSPDQPDVAESAPQPGPADSRAAANEDEAADNWFTTSEDDELQRRQKSPQTKFGPHPDQARHVVRLFQCPQCSAPYKHAISLPCGRSICKTCLPETFIRTSVSYPALPYRQEGFRCPFSECGQVHASDDCSSDVILNKVAWLVHTEMNRGKVNALRLKLSTRIGIQAAQSLMTSPQLIPGSRLVATWTLAAHKQLPFKADALFYDEPASREKADECDSRVLGTLQKTMRVEMDCQICYGLLYDPLTTECGHTFCRACLLCVFTKPRRCPVCRRELGVDPLLKPGVCPSNERIVGITQTFWKDELDGRKESAALESAATQHPLLIPLLVCSLSFPSMPMFLHIYESRYRLMIERVLQGDQTFGMVLPRQQEPIREDDFYQMGILLQIIEVHYYADGRSMIETVGLYRFRILSYTQRDGYYVGNAQRMDDVGLQQEEAMEAAEVGYDASDSAAGTHGDGDLVENQGQSSAEAPFWTSWSQFGAELPETVEDLNTMTTQSLMRGPG